YSFAPASAANASVSAAAVGSASATSVASASTAGSVATSVSATDTSGSTTTVSVSLTAAGSSAAVLSPPLQALSVNNALRLRPDSTNFTTDFFFMVFCFMVIPSSIAC